MFKVFFRIYGFIFCGALAVFAIWYFVHSQITSQMMTGNLRERYRASYILLEDALSPYPESQWKEQFKRITQRFPYPAQLIEIRNSEEVRQLPEVHRQLLDEGRIITLPTQRTAGLRILKRIDASGYAVLFDFPGPSSDRLIVPLIFTTIELLLFAVIMYLWVRPFWRDLTTLAAASERISKGEFGERVNLPGNSALFPLARSFNLMTQRIAALVESHKGLTNAIAHEFRTPLTRLRFRQELAVEAETLTEKNTHLHKMDASLNQLTHLSNELLEFARMNREAPTLHRQPVSAQALLTSIVEEARELAGSREKLIDVTGTTDVGQFDADPFQIERALSNLVRNAVEHCAGKIAVNITWKAPFVVLSVADDGPGIREDMREKVFEPFVRLGEERSGEVDGFGLGLAIVRQIAALHGGHAVIAASEMGGALVQIQIPSGDSMPLLPEH
ncbi:MAG: ATP-binding protein [Burkholderiales bacterium]|nr:ATP-binding protein [Burkholderiales bacterium]